MTSAAIVTTLRSPGPSIVSFVRWHRAVGFERIYLYFDDPDDPDVALADALPGVTVIRAGDEVRAAIRRHPACRRIARRMGDVRRPHSTPEQVMARQLGHAALAIDRAREEGLGWLVHLDADELFDPGGESAPDHFARLEALGAGTATYVNHEAVPERLEHADPFAELTVFARNEAAIDPATLAEAHARWGRRGDWFLAYDNGKSAVRLVEGASPAGVHGFRVPRGALGDCRLMLPRVLHYPCWSFHRYWDKHRRLGDFPGDRVFGGQWQPPAFLLASRDLARRGRESEARERYRKEVVLRGGRLRERLLALGALTRIEGPARLLGESAPR